MLPYNNKLKKLSQKLRREMTNAERRLWSRLRRRQILGIQFYRPKPIANYIVDFYAPAAKLVAEVDGAHHFEAENIAADWKRTECLQHLGLTVLRFDNAPVLTQLDDVISEIHRMATAKIPMEPLLQSSASPISENSAVAHNRPDAGTADQILPDPPFPKEGTR